MKILIDNRTNLSNEETGHFIDRFLEIHPMMKDYFECEKWRNWKFRYEDKIINMEALLKKRYLKITISEAENFE